MTTLFTNFRGVQLVRYLILLYAHLIPLLSNTLRSNTYSLSFFFIRILHIPKSLILILFIIIPYKINYSLILILLILILIFFISLYPYILISHLPLPFLIYSSLFLILKTESSAPRLINNPAGKGGGAELTECGCECWFSWRTKEGNVGTEGKTPP